MSSANNHSPGFATLAGRLLRTGLGALRTRMELFVVEWEEERLRMMQVVGWSIGLIFTAVLTALLFTATIIFLFREDLRIYVTGAFAFLYAIGALAAWFGLRKLLMQRPFADTRDQVQKDRAWLETLK